MSGLLALLDDVAAIAKIAATSVDDVMAQAVKAGAKASGAVIDDAAVTPKFIHGFEPARELPIVWQIARGSIRNKLLILLPAALLLSAFAPWLITPLLMLGGAYLCFEGAEKVVHVFQPHEGPDAKAAAATPENPLHLEKEKVAGAIKTDFILSAEIMTIILAAIPESNFWMEAFTLAAAGVGITVLVYGSVALIVKADDVGLHMAEEGRLGITRALGRGIVRAMPGFLKLLTAIGTAAMLWVGGSIVVHGLESLGFAWLGHHIHDLAVAAGHAVQAAEGAVEWTAKAAMDGVFGLALGFVLIPVANTVLVPLWSAVTGAKAQESH
jgi:predicted DNA repair protein MutK